MTLNTSFDEIDTDKIATGKAGQGETDPIQKALSQEYDQQDGSQRSKQRNRRRGFTPPRRGRPRRTISGGSR